MTFLSGSRIQSHIKRAVKVSSSLDLAVAFWGRNAMKRIGLRVSKRRRVRIICNLSMGATNPAEVRAIRSRLRSAGKGSGIRQRDNLHSKVYAFDTHAIVGSANASSNGLALEGDEARSLIEAAIVTDSPGDLAAIRDWFAAEWRRARRINSADLNAADERWRNRRLVTQRIKPAPSNSGLPVGRNWFLGKEGKFRVIWYRERLTRDETRSAATLRKTMPELPSRNWGCFVENGIPLSKIRRSYRPDSMAFCYFVGKLGPELTDIAYFPPGELLARRKQGDVYVFYISYPLRSLPKSLGDWNGFAEINKPALRRALKRKLSAVRKGDGAEPLDDFLF